ncbi:MAG: endopeptidase [Vicinamibacteria bacterium]
MRHRRSGGITCAVVASAFLVSVTASALVPEAGPSALAARAFVAPELTISSANVPLERLRTQLPSRGAWDALERSGTPIDAYIDPRSGAATSLVEAVPLVPGSGVGNAVTLDDVSRRIGRAAPTVDAGVVADAVLAHVRQRKGVLGIDPAQLGAVRASRVDPELWQVSIPQRYRDVPVRHGRLVATISHGNLIVLGAETWGDVALASVEPTVSAEAALEAGFAHVGGRVAEDAVKDAPALEIVPTAPQELQRGEGFAGPVGRGYRHRLVWTFGFERPPSPERWELMVDAHDGTVLAMEDRNQYLERRQVVGGVYPVTNTETCTVPQRCGRMQSGTPMPNVHVFIPQVWTSESNQQGLFWYAGGTPSVEMRGTGDVEVSDGCPGAGTVAHGFPDGNVDLRGLNGDHDCDGAGPGAFTAASRTTLYETNRMREIARGYLPEITWVKKFPSPDGLQATTNRDVSQGAACNSFWNGSLNFYASGDGCRNPGEIASIIDHEWAHGLDQNDANGVLSNSSEGYADVAGIYRTRDSCVGYGLFQTRDHGCGALADGSGFNVDEGQTGTPHCTTDCSGVRDADFAKHADGVPDTPANFVCGRCVAGSGPCGRQTHCAAAPQRQAAWDLAARDLQAPPFDLDGETAFLRADRLFYRAAGAVGSWYSCECGQSPSSSGCAAGNAYLQWLAADDDNGTLADGTPHSSAIFAAFDRHGIACGVAPQPSPPCGIVAQGQPTLKVVDGVIANFLSWTEVPGAQTYSVFKSDGPAGCSSGKTKIANVAYRSYADIQVAAGHPYFYVVVAEGGSSACSSRASKCVRAAPRPAETFTLACAPGAVIPGPTAAVCTVTGTTYFDSPVTLGCVGLPSGVASCTFDPPTVTSAQGASVSSTLKIQAGVSAAPGTYAFQVRGAADPNVSGPEVPMTLTVGAAAGGDLVAAFDPALQAPSCGAVVGRSCDSRTLVRGRATTEPNPPNAIAGSCADGASGSGSNDRIRIATDDGMPFAAGRKVVVTADVTARAAFDQDVVDVFFAAEAASPVWQYAGSATPTASGPQTLSAGYKLPAGTRQAVRVQFRGGGTPVACAPGTQDDRDDLVFAVAQ